jgi:hypothetical protein
VLALSIRNSDATATLLFLYKLLEVRKDQGGCFCYLFFHWLSLRLRFSEGTNRPDTRAMCFQTLKDYFGNVEEESIKDNFVIMYELLDEMMDFGYPQLSEARLLKEFITQEGHQLLKSQVTVPKAVTGVVSWRPDNITYKKNEVFLDVIEKVNLLVSATGALLRSEIQGRVNVKAYLSGMPELRLGLNDRIQFGSLDRGSQTLISTPRHCISSPLGKTPRTEIRIPSSWRT